MQELIRIEKIIALLEAHPLGISGQELADACDVPWPVMFKDLQNISCDQENAIPLYNEKDGGDDEDEEDDENDGSRPIDPQIKWALQACRKRNSPLHLTVGETVQILESLEYFQSNQEICQSLKQKLFSSLDITNAGKFRCVKGNMTPVERIGERYLLLAEQAILRRHRIFFEFNERPVTVDPLGLVYYSRLRQWYLVARSDQKIKTFNLSKIHSLQELMDNYGYPPDFSLRQWLAPYWGMEFGEAIHVRVRFRNRSQTLAKVRKDVAHRQCRLIEEEEGESLIYEDTLIGENEFIVWILGFGSAAEVIEPLELRNRVIDKVRETLNRYHS